MRFEQWKGWRAVTIALVVIWIALVSRLMIADVWDETNGMLAFSAPTPLAPKLHFVLTQSLGFWRPLPALLVTVVLHFVRDFDVSWRVLRCLNAAMLLGTCALLARAFRGVSGEFRGLHGLSETAPTTPNAPLTTLFTLSFLFSSSSLITAGWYANVFDASALLLIAIALTLLLSKELDAGLSARRASRDVAAGTILGVAFFCKESAALALPFLFVLFAAGRITFKQSLRAGIPATLLGALYFFIRSKIVPFGSAGDVHGFDPAQFVPTLLHLGESFWEQTLKSHSVFGFIFLAISLIALRRVRVIAAMLLFLLATAIIYWGMFGEYQNGAVMHHLNFTGRLYLIPAALFLFLLALERRPIAMAILLLPIVYGAVLTVRDHTRFQRTYARIYARAPIAVHYPAKPLDDTVRGVKIGDIPTAPLQIEQSGLRQR
jgi:hypothetical protein